MTLLAVPMVLELSLEAVFALCDVFFVSRLGADAVAAVGLTEAVMTIVFSIATGLAMGTTALVARRVGERDFSGASTAAGQSILMSTLAALPISLAGFLFADSILLFMGASPSVVQMGSGYCRIMLTGNLTVQLLFVINAVFRGAGDAVVAMRALWLGNLINLVLDPLLIFGFGPIPRLGVDGAAVATNIARGAAIFYQCQALVSRRRSVRVSGRDLRINLRILRHLIYVSLGGVLQFLIGTASWIGLVRIIALFGSASVAGYTIAMRVIVFAILPSWGMANAAATLVGQNLGAGQPDRAERSVWVAGKANMVFLGIVTVLFTVAADPITRLFTDEPEVIGYAVQCLRFVSCGYVFYAWGMVITQAFNGAGDTYTPTVINLCIYWLFQIPFAYLLAIGLGFGASGAFLAITIAESLLAVVALLVFRQGNWKRKSV